MQVRSHHTLTVQAQALLGDDRVIAFLTSAGLHSTNLAIDLANGFLRDGRSVDFILSPPLRGSAGFSLFAQYIQHDLARIEFALWTDHQKRSSGTWEVRFALNEVVDIMDVLAARAKPAPIPLAALRIV